MMRIMTFTQFHEHTVYTPSVLRPSLYTHTATRRVNLLINRTNNVPRDTRRRRRLSPGSFIARKIQLSRFLFNFYTTTADAPPPPPPPPNCTTRVFWKHTIFPSIRHQWNFHLSSDALMKFAKNQIVLREIVFFFFVFFPVLLPPRQSYMYK